LRLDTLIITNLSAQLAMFLPRYKNFGSYNQLY